MKYFIFIVLFFVSCSILKKPQEVNSLIAPDNTMIVIEEGQTLYVPVGDVLDSNDVTRFSDTLTILATKSEIGAGGLDGFQNSNDSTVLSTSSMDYTIRRDIVTFDIPDSIQGTFPVGTLIRTRGFYSPGDGAGALYQVQADSVAGYVNDTAAVVPLTSGYAILQPQNGQYDVTWFGAVGDGVTNNGNILYKASQFGRPNKLLFPAGVYLYDSSVVIGSYGINMSGVGGGNFTTTAATVLQYIGTGSAIDFEDNILAGTFRTNRLLIQDLAIVGTDSALYGINIDRINHTGSITTAAIRNISVKGFTGADSYGIYISRAYNLHITGCHITDNTSGIFLGGEAIGCNLSNLWIRNSSKYGIHNTYGGNSLVDNCIITVGDFTAESTQRGIYSPVGDLVVNNVLLEGNYIHIEAGATASMSISGCKFNGFEGTHSCVFADGAKVRLFGNILGGNNPMDVGLGTEWIGDIGGYHQIPVITSDNPAGFATITYTDGSAGSFNITGYATTAIPDGPFTIVFQDDSVGILHVPSGGDRIILKDGLPFHGYAGDQITLQKRTNIGGTTTIVELGRVRASDNHHQSRVADYNIKLGESGLTFNNYNAADTVEFNLPGISSFYQKPEFTFINTQGPVVKIYTSSSGRRIRGSSTNNTAIYLPDVGSSVTLKLDSMRWDIVASHGLIIYEAPDATHTGGTIAGMSIDRLRDSIGVTSTTYTAGRIPYTDPSGNLAVDNRLQTTVSTSSNSTVININDNANTQMYTGIGYHNSTGTSTLSRYPTVSGHLDEIRTSRGALSLEGFRYAGTYGSKSNMTDSVSVLVGITGTAWRGNAARSAAGITFQGGRVMTGSGYSGVIGFATSNGTTYARRATIQRNGDFYLGDGLPTNDLASPSSKLLLRGNGTTTGNLFLAEDSNGDDKFILQDNGTITLPVSPTLNNTADSVIVRNNVTGSLEVRSATSISGGFQAYTAQSSTYNVTASDNIIECTANSFTLNFPSAVGLTGKEWTVKNTGVGIITIEPDGAETIDGQPNTILTTQKSITIFSNGVNLLIK